MVTGSECARQLGIAQSKLSHLFNAGLVKGEKLENGRTMFSVEAVREELAKLDGDMKSTEEAAFKEKRKYKKKAAVEEEEVSEEMLDEMYKKALKSAHYKAKQAYRNFLLTVIDECEKDARCAPLELNLLRHYANIDGLFQEIKPGV